jgi:hypothetical protein
MSYDRSECPLPGRVDRLRPDRLLILRRAPSGPPELYPLSPSQAARALVAGTYLAGELRRYWSFAAALALGTGRGPAHPAVPETALELARRLPAYELVLGDRPEEGLAALRRFASTGSVHFSGTGGSDRAEATP